MAYSYEYPRPAVTVDCIIFGLDESHQLKVLLIQRATEPYKEFWALPGGFVESEETLREAALRELEEETGVKDVFVEQLFTFGDPGRDPRGRVISVAYYALVNLGEHELTASSEVSRAEWFEINDLPRLAFDHHKIFEAALTRLRAKVRYQPIGFELLPEKFTLTQLQQLYEIILGMEGSLNKRNFRKRILDMGILQEVGIQEGVAHRPAKLYSFDKEKYHELEARRYKDLLRRGIDFEI